MKYLGALLILFYGAVSLRAQTPAQLEKFFSKSSTADELVLKAKDYLKVSDYAMALRTLEDALKFCPGDARRHLDVALQNYAAADFAEAQREVILANQGYPKLGLIFFLSGIARLRTKDFYGAVTDLSLALYLQPTVTMIYANRGMARYEIGDFSGAIEDFTVQINAGRPQELARAYSFRGQARYERGDPGGALADLNTAITLDPAEVGAYFRRSLLHKRNGNFLASIQDCDAALLVAPKDQYVLALRMWLHHEVGSSDSAHHDVDILLQSDPDSPQFHFYEATLYDAENQSAPAAAAYRKTIALAQKPADRDLWISANFHLDLLQRRTTGIKSTAYLADVFEWSDDWPKRLGIYLAGRTSDDALERDARNTKDTFRRQQQECDAFYFIGMRHLLDGSLPSARDYFEKTIATQQADTTEYNFARKQLLKLQENHISTAR